MAKVTLPTTGPDIWLKHPTMVKVRAKLGTWSAEDVVAYARFSTGSDQLNKQQVAELAVALRAPNLPKAPAEHYAGGAGLVSTLPVAITFRANGPFKRANLADTTHWYLSGNRAELWHGNVKDLVWWALVQCNIDPRVGWSDRLAQWRDKHRMKRLERAALNGFPLDPMLETALANRLEREGRMLVNLPDNAALKKQYWGLQVGDKLVSPDGATLVVRNVRCNLGTPPTVTFDPLEAPDDGEA